jgi:uncharacterized protein YggE
MMETMGRMTAKMTVAVAIGMAVIAGGVYAMVQAAPTAGVPASTGALPVESLRHVRVTSEGAVYVTPDEVSVSFGVTSSSADLDKVKAEVDQRTTELVRAIKDAGVPAEQIQTAQVDVSLSYQDWQKRTGRKYVATRNYQVKLKDVSMLAKVMNAAFENGANMMGGVSYGSSELRQQKDEARKLAIRAAKEKAELLAGELGAKVGRVLTIVEASDTVVPWGPGRMTNMLVGAAAAVGTTEESLPTGKIAVRASVTVAFEIVD